VDGLNGLHGGVFASQGFEVWSEEGLDAEGDAGDAEFFVEMGGAGGEGGRVRFEGDLFDLREIEGFAESFEEFAKVGGREHGGGSAAKIDRLEGREVFLRSETGFGEEGFDEGAEIGAARGMLVKRTIRAHFTLPDNLHKLLSLR